MQTAEMKLDGNALGGVMAELFGREMTTASSSCRWCGAVEQLACVDVYVKAPGTVARCRHCDGVLMKIVQGPDRTWLDLSGVSVIELRA
jgi:Family of unknown function (DUF6510)